MFPRSRKQLWIAALVVLATVTVMALVYSGIMTTFSPGQLGLVAFLLVAALAAFWIYLLRWTWPPTKLALADLAKRVRRLVGLDKSDPDEVSLDDETRAVRAYYLGLSLARSTSVASQVTSQEDEVSRETRQFGKMSADFREMGRQILAQMTDSELEQIADFWARKMVPGAVAVSVLEVLREERDLAQQGQFDPAAHLFRMAQAAGRSKSV